MMSKLVAYVFKNIATLLGIAEAILKAIGGIVSLTPTRRDDAIVEMVDKAFSAIKRVLYNVSDKLAGSEPTAPNS